MFHWLRQVFKNLLGQSDKTDKHLDGISRIIFQQAKGLGFWLTESEIEEIISDWRKLYPRCDTGQFFQLLDTGYLSLQIFKVAGTFELALVPSITKFNPCRGCKFYSGSALICAVHPYGPDGDTCPDWQFIRPK